MGLDVACAAVAVAAPPGVHLWAGLGWAGGGGGGDIKGGVRPGGRGPRCTTPPLTSAPAAPVRPLARPAKNKYVVWFPSEGSKHITGAIGCQPEFLPDQGSSCRLRDPCKHSYTARMVTQTCFKEEGKYTDTLAALDRAYCTLGLSGVRSVLPPPPCNPFTGWSDVQPNTPLALTAALPVLDTSYPTRYPGEVPHTSSLHLTNPD